MRLSGIHTYPVKALGGGARGGSDVRPWGLEGDRNWMVVDPSGHFLTQRRHAAMATIRAEDTPGGMLLTDGAGATLFVPTPAPDAERVSVTVWRDVVPARSATQAADAWLGERLGAPCRLVHLGDKRARKISPDYAADGAPVSFADGFPLLLTNAASLADLNARLAHPVPMGRFRPNLVIDGAEAWEEDTWRRIRIGGAVFRIAKPCERCIVTTIDPVTGERPDPAEPLRTLGPFRRDARGGVMFGQNIIPERTGLVRLGDAVEVLERGRPNVELLPPASPPSRRPTTVPARWRAHVAAIDVLAPDVRRLVVHVQGSPPRYRAGQYLSLVLPDGTRRSLSPACAARDDGRITFHMQRRAGGMLTGLVFGGWRVGDPLGLEGPFGQCVLDDGASPVLMLATGTGLAPMLAMLEEILAAASPRAVTLYWGGRQMADLYAADELTALSRAQASFRFVPVLSSAGSYVQDRAAAELADLSGMAVYACGAPRMVDAARQRLLALPGATADRFFADAFEPAAAATAIAADAPSILVRPSGGCVRVAMGGSLLSGLANAGVAIQSICGGHASCGTCRVRLAPEWTDRVPPVGRAERRLLAVLREPAPAHRLACQIALEAHHADLAFGARSVAPVCRCSFEPTGVHVMDVAVEQEAQLERVGAAFAREKMLFARDRVRGAIHEVAAARCARSGAARVPAARSSMPSPKPRH